MRPLPLALALTLLAAGCGGGASSLYHGGSVPPAGTPVYQITPGVASPVIVAGRDVGYYITANTGGSFRLFWTGDVLRSGANRHFYGSVWTNGNFTTSIPGCLGGACPLSGNTFISTVKVIPGGSRIDFDSTGGADIQGFDFIVDTVPALFDLAVDGQRRPDYVTFPATANGGAPSPSGAMPFGLTTE